MNFDITSTYLSVKILNIKTANLASVTIFCDGFGSQLWVALSQFDSNFLDSALYQVKSR